MAVGWVSLRLRRWARDPRVEITLSLLTPYAAFLVPQHFGGSGVLATVAAGLFVSWNGPLLIPAATRLQGIFFWDLIVYFLEGFVFLITGMQTRTLLNRMDMDLAARSGIRRAADRGRVVAARFIWVYPAVYLPRWLSPAVARRDPLPPWQWTFILAFVGVRGVVSLAAALAIPLTTAAGAPFPDRDLILFVTFGLIVVTLVGQGIALPACRPPARARARTSRTKGGASTRPSLRRVPARSSVAQNRLEQFAGRWPRLTRGAGDLARAA